MTSTVAPALSRSLCGAVNLMCFFVKEVAIAAMAVARQNVAWPAIVPRHRTSSCLMSDFKKNVELSVGLLDTELHAGARLVLEGTCSFPQSSTSFFY